MYIPGVLKGLWVTIAHFVDTFTHSDHFPHRYAADGIARRKAPLEHGLFTVQYPEERLPVYPRFRGCVVQLRDPETGKPRCQACGVCARACPQGTIRLIVEGRGHERVLKTYELDNRRCTVCGLCVEACAFGALAMSPFYELATYDKDELVFDMDRLLALGDAYQAQRDQKGAKG